MADQGLVGRDRRDAAFEYLMEGIVFHLVPDAGGGGMGIDGIDSVGRDARHLDAFGDAAADGFKMGRHKVMGVGGHGPSGDFQMP